MTANCLGVDHGATELVKRDYVADSNVSLPFRLRLCRRHIGASLAAFAVLLMISAVRAQDSNQLSASKASDIKAAASGKKGTQESTESVSRGTDAKASPSPDEKRAVSFDSMSLDELLATALRENPDIRLAEARLREAESELNRIRLEVLQKIFVQRREWEVQREKLKEYEVRAKNAEKLAGSKAIPEEELRLAKVNLEVNRLMLAKLDEELAFILGRTPHPTPLADRNATLPKAYLLQNNTPEQVSPAVLQAVQEVDRDATVSAYAPNNSVVVSGSPEAHVVASAVIRVLDQSQSQRPSSVLSRGTSEKLLQTLSKQVEVNFKETQLSEVLKSQRDSHGLRFVTAPGNWETSYVTLDLEAPLGAVLEAISDVAGVQFDVREYGILVSRRIGPGAGSLIDLWKTHQAPRR